MTRPYPLATARLNLTSRDIAWVAGLVEGEGCFSRTSSGIRLAITMTDRDVLERLAAYWAASIQPKAPAPRRKPAYTITLHGARAAAWMMTLYPLLLSRRQARVRALLSLWRRQRRPGYLKTQCPRGHPLEPAYERDRGPLRRCRYCRRIPSRRRGPAHPAQTALAYD